LRALSADTNDWLNGAGKPIALGRIKYIQKALADFDEIKERMIALENDDLEERLYRWHVLVMFSELEEFADYLLLTYPDFAAKYSADAAALPGLRRAAFASTMLADAQTAESLVKELEAYAIKPEPRLGLAFIWSLRKDTVKPPATASAPAPVQPPDPGTPAA
jgi:hypothetical protein